MTADHFTESKCTQVAVSSCVVPVDNVSPDPCAFGAAGPIQMHSILCKGISRLEEATYTCVPLFGECQALADIGKMIEGRTAPRDTNECVRECRIGRWLLSRRAHIWTIWEVARRTDRLYLPSDREYQCFVDTGIQVNSLGRI